MTSASDTGGARALTPAVRAGAASRYSVDLLRATIAPNATDGELLMFSRVCARFDLSPFADQIVLVPRYDRRVGREVHRHQITVAGRRTLATRTGELVGIDGPTWTGPRDPHGELHWVELWDDDQAPPYAARCFVHRKGWVGPANGTAKWSEFAQFGRDGTTLLQQWKAMPSHMLGKVAESMALRRAFPEAIEPAVAELGDDELPAPPRDPDRVELGDADPDTIDVDAEPDDDTASDAPPPREPTAAEQADAHRAIGALDPDVKQAWLDGWGIDDFGTVWPADAVADALTRPF